jgi:hypothetical protein
MTRTLVIMQVKQCTENGSRLRASSNEPLLCNTILILGTIHVPIWECTTRSLVYRSLDDSVNKVTDT